MRRGPQRGKVRRGADVQGRINRRNRGHTKWGVEGNRGIGAGPVEEAGSEGKGEEARTQEGGGDAANAMEMMWGVQAVGSSGMGVKIWTEQDDSRQVWRERTGCGWRGMGTGRG